MFLGAFDYYYYRTVCLILEGAPLRRLVVAGARKRLLTLRRVARGGRPSERGRIVPSGNIHGCTGEVPGAAESWMF